MLEAQYFVFVVHSLIVYNFNHERWMICQWILGLARAAFADAFMWARQRKVFGKTLVQQPVIRNKLAHSAAALESVWTYLEAVTYDMCNTTGGALNPRMGGVIAMLKYHTTRSCLAIADDCVQVRVCKHVMFGVHMSVFVS